MFPDAVDLYLIKSNNSVKIRNLSAARHAMYQNRGENFSEREFSG